MIMYRSLAIKMPGIRSLLLGTILLQSISSIAQQADTAGLVRVGVLHKVGDSLKAYIKEPLAPKPLQWKAVVVPTVLITYGTLAVTTNWFDDVNLLGRRWASGTAQDAGRRRSTLGRRHTSG